MSQSLEFKIPEGYIFDKDNSTDAVIRFKPIKKKIKYHNIAEKLFLNKITYFINVNGEICSHLLKGNPSIANNATSEKQLEQLLALNKLMNVAKYLNGDWKINWKSTQEKYYIVYDYWKYVLTVTCTNSFQSTLVYFESPSLAKQAIEILGEEEVKKALGIFE
jgi:hypothetical protein